MRATAAHFPSNIALMPDTSSPTLAIDTTAAPELRRRTPGTDWDAASGHPARRPWWKRLALAFTIWTSLALLFTTQDYLALLGTEQEMPLSDILLHKLAAWWLWGAISPLTFAFARHFPISGRHGVRNALLHIIAGAFFAFVILVLFTIVGRPLGLISHPELSLFDLVLPGYRRSFAINLAVYAGTVMVHHAYEFYMAYRRRERIALQLEARLAEARLDALRMQLQPHFLFNTLHGISALMERDVSAARTMIARLSNLLRLSLENDESQETSLGNELEFLEQYVEIQRMRFQDRLTVTIEAPPEIRRLRVPRLILQPLVENSIRHGLARHARAGSITVTAHREGNRLVIMVRDDGPGLRAGPLREGVGIGNTRARLEHLHGDEQSFTIANAPEGGATVTITLPARTADDEENP